MITAHDAHLRSKAYQLKLVEKDILAATEQGATHIVIRPTTQLADGLVGQLRDRGFEVSQYSGPWVLEVKWNTPPLTDV